VLTRTFLGWDLAGSTRAWESSPELARDSVNRWVDAARKAIPAHGGKLFKLVGDGGWAEFDSARAAVDAALDLQLLGAGGDAGARTALYSGEAELQPDGDWLGVPLNRCSRLLSLGHPGQILIAGSTALLLGSKTDDLRELGLYNLRDVAQPIVVYQLVSDELPSAFPPIRSGISEVRLPTTRDQLIGREAHVVHVQSLLVDHRLVTLAGVGGTGKTRLAIEVASAMADDFQLTTFVDLVSARLDTHVASAVLDAVGAMSPDEAPEPEMVAEVLGERRVLLVIDNAEHVLDGVADLVEVLLDRCPGVRLLVTSREPLGVRSECVWRVPSLDVSGSAVDLYRDRLGAPVDAVLAEELCSRLDGIPLAIELAAARARSLGTEEVLRNLSDRFRILVGGRRARGRQATLQAALDWSHQLLDTDEQLLLRRLSPFSGGFTARAAGEVAGRLPSRDTRDVLASLVDKSLVVLESETGRHRLLETVRAFAHDRLVEADEAVVMHDAHARWIADDFAAQPFADTSTLRPLLPETPNLRAALDWLYESGRDVDFLRLVRASRGLWLQQMMEADLYPQATAAFERSREEMDRCEQVESCVSLAFLSADRLTWLTEAVALDPHRECDASLSTRAFGAIYTSYTDPVAARAELDPIADALRSGGPDRDLLRIVIESHIRYLSGDEQGADDLYRTLLDGHPSIMTFGPLCGLVSMRVLRGDIGGAEEVYAHVIADPDRGTRLGVAAVDGVHCQILTARNLYGEAAAALRLVEAIRDRHLAFYPAADNTWFDAAAFLAARTGHVAEAAVLTWASGQRQGLETSPFTSWVLSRELADRPEWHAVVAAPPTIERARECARWVARQY